MVAALRGAPPPPPTVLDGLSTTATHGRGFNVCARDKQRRHNFFRTSRTRRSRAGRQPTWCTCCGPEGLLGGSKPVQTGPNDVALERFLGQKRSRSIIRERWVVFDCGNAAPGMTGGLCHKINDLSFYVCEEAGVDVLWSCMEGVGGPCEETLAG